jgi:hypothetical protein
VSLSVSFSREGMKADLGEMTSISPTLARREPVTSSTSKIGDIDDLACSSLGLCPNADAPKKYWPSRPRSHDVGREGGRGSSGLKSVSVDLPNSPDDAIDGLYILMGAVAKEGLDS